MKIEFAFYSKRPIDIQIPNSYISIIPVPN